MMTNEYDCERNALGLSQLITINNDFDIEINPFKIIDKSFFDKRISSILIEKNKINDINLLRMSYIKLAFTLSLMEFINKDTVKNIIELLEKCTNLKYGLAIKLDNQIEYFDVEILYQEKQDKTKNLKILKMLDNKNSILSLYIKNENKIVLRNKDFELIKSTIIKQNDIMVLDKTLHPELRESIEKGIEIKSKKSNMKPLDEQIIIYHVGIGLPYSEIKNLTLYQFKRGLDEMRNMKDYEINKSAEYNGVKFKEEIRHWLINTPSIYDSLIIGDEQIDNMKQSINKK